VTPEKLQAAIEAQLVKIEAALLEVRRLQLLQLLPLYKVEADGTVELLPEEKPTRKRSARSIPENWKPRPEEIEWCARAFPKLDWKDEAHRFVDYWTGTGKQMVDWNATFRNWLRNANKFAVRDEGRRPAVKAASVNTSNRDKASRVGDRLNALRQERDGGSEVPT
jgi:hypothetical protein